jgi:hypothetical protein
MEHDVMRRISVVISRNKDKPADILTSKILGILNPLIEPAKELENNLETKDLKKKVLKKNQESPEKIEMSIISKNSDDYDPMEVIPNYDVPVTTPKKNNNLYQLPDEQICRARKWGPDSKEYPRCRRMVMANCSYCIVHMKYRPFGEI